MLYEKLQKAGLTENEAKIYLAVLELGQTSVSRVARNAGVKRTTVYFSLESLIHKGLLTQIIKDGKKIIFAENPRSLERLMEEKKERINKLLPTLMSFANLIDKKPAVQHFEGTDGVKEVLRDVLNYPDQEVLMMYSESSILDFEDKFFSDYYVPERVKRKISARVLVPDNEVMRQNMATNQESLRQSKMLPPNLFNIQVEIMVYGKNKINLSSFKEKFGMIIESQIIHDGFKGIFETLWNSEIKNNHREEIETDEVE